MAPSGIFLAFFQDLYMSMYVSSSQDFDTFTARLPISALLEEHRKLMEKDITADEVLTANNQAPFGTTPVFSAQYSKKMDPLLVNPLTHYFKAIQRGGFHKP